MYAAPMDRAAFLRRALEIIQEAHPFDASVIDEEKFAIVSVSPTGASHLAWLGNFWAEYSAADTPRAKEAVLERFARSSRFVDSEETFDEIRVLLRPRIRPRTMFEVDAKQAVEAIQQGDAEVPALFYRPLAEHLGVGLAIDRPDRIQYITDVSEYKLSGDELLAMALSNLRDATRTGLEKLEDGLWAGSWGDEFAPERVLLDELFRDLPAGCMVFLPGADRIFVVDPRARAALHRALELVEERLERPRSIVSFALRREEGEWRVVDDPAFPGISERLTAHLAPYYEKQREACMAARDRSDDADLPSCASVLSVPSDRGTGDVSMCLWSRFQDTLLPRTDVLQLLDIDRRTALLVPWRVFLQRCGDCVSLVPGMYPLRYRTKEFPSDEALEELGKHRYQPAPRGGRAATNGREAGFRPLTEPDAPDLPQEPAWSFFSGKTIAYAVLGLGGVLLVCGLVDRLSGCG